MKTLFTALMVSSVLMSSTAFGAMDDAVIEQSFYPYKNGLPTADGYEPGVEITQQNVDSYKAILDDFMYRYIKQGWYTIKTSPTTSFDLYPGYVDATRAHAESVKLTPDGLLDGFVAGRPFPQEPDANDPEAGLKLVWNFQRGFNAGDSETIKPFWWTFRNMNNDKVERVIKFDWHFLNWKHRSQFDPKPDILPNPGQIFRSIYGKVLEPFDLANTQLLIHRYENDLKRDDAWLYLGFQRRVRRLATGQITDAFLGTDAMIEDFEGYNGRVSDYKWKYIETKNVLLPFYNHNEMDLSSEPANDPDGFKFVKVAGKGGCFPDVTWQLRKTYVVEGNPKDSNHPLSKRTIYLDVQTGIMSVLLSYDKKGDPWKYFPIGKTHSDNHIARNKGTGVAIDDFAVFLDEQAMHCTTLQFKSVINPEENAANIFSVQNLRKQGR
ncbi:MAG: DUF1329 domain-containing protein [Candidatus Thiodiazotropha sp. (ex Lucinoma borealis)]|nr:DUF1329 domain-containing protein [Candidatus Thiodiazotropha sp. (ex Lucinoma borealis)]